MGVEGLALSCQRRPGVELYHLLSHSTFALSLAAAELWFFKFE